MIVWYCFVYLLVQTQNSADNESFDINLFAIFLVFEKSLDLLQKIAKRQNSKDDNLN